jgi:hypothetical protein
LGVGLRTGDRGISRIRRAHDIGHRHLIRPLVDARLDEDTAERDVHALHDGRALVLVRGDEAATGCSDHRGGAGRVRVRRL